MKNEKLLKKIIKKAVKNGWNILKFFDVCENCYKIEQFNIETAGNGDISGLTQFYFIEEKSSRISRIYKERKLYEIIFSHSFAKKYWGESKRYYSNCNMRELWDINEARLRGLDDIPLEFEWEFRLQQMVLEEDKLKYLERFLGE